MYPSRGPQFGLSGDDERCLRFHFGSYLILNFFINYVGKDIQAKLHFDANYLIICTSAPSAAQAIEEIVV